MLIMDINLATLRKFDSSVVRVIHSAGHVALYKFDKDLSGWKKTDVEGSLFICLCEGNSMYKMFVLNRLNPENFVLQIDLTFDCVEKDEFLLYRNLESIGAVWFFNEHERSKVIKCLNTLTKMVSSQSSENQIMPGVSVSSNGNAAEEQSNITTLLDNAYQKFLMEKSAKNRKNVAKRSGSEMTSDALNSLAQLAMDSRPKEPLHPLLQNMFVSHGSFPGTRSGTSENDAVNNLFQEKANFNETRVAAANGRGRNRFPFNHSYISNSDGVSQERLKKPPTRSHNIEVECFRRALLSLVKEDDDFCEKLYVRYKQAMEASGKLS